MNSAEYRYLMNQRSDEVLAVLEEFGKSFDLGKFFKGTRVLWSPGFSVHPPLTTAEQAAHLRKITEANYVTLYIKEEPEEVREEQYRRW